MTAKLTIDGAEEPYKSLTISESVSQIGSWSASLPSVRDLAAFAPVTVVKDGVAVFGGRLQEPTNRFSRGGSVNNVRGFDYSVRLTDYLTPYSSIVDSSTATAIDTILANTPFTASIESTFGYEYPLVLYNTSLEFMQFIYSNTCIIFDPTAAFEVDEEIHDAITAHLSEPHLRASVVTDAYIFYFWENAAGDIYYDSKKLSDQTDKGATDTTVNTNTQTHYAVGYDGTYIYLFVEDGAGNTDLYRGTIAGDAVTFAIRKDNVVAGWIQWAMALDNEGDFWIAYNNAIYESTDGGLNWNNRGNTGGLPIHALFIGEDAGDIHAIVEDAGNTDLEHWQWDKSAGTFTFKNKIDDITSLDHVSGGVDTDYNIHVAWEDDFAGAADINYCEYDADAGTWGAVTTVEDHTQSEPAGKQPITGTMQACCDAAGNVYIYWSSQTGNHANLSYLLDDVWYNSSNDGWVTINQSCNHICCPQGYMPNNNVAQGVSVTEDVANDLRMQILGFTSVVLGEGVATGSIRSPTITASGAMQRWGSMLAIGTGLTDTEWSILKAADNSVLVDEQPHNFNLNIAGVPATETSIKVYADITSGSAAITSILVNEVLDVLSMELDYDTVYEALTKWSKLSGGEFWLDEDDVLHLADTRGTDKSGTVILKNARTPRHPGTPPNIKVVDVKTDWTSYVNSIRVLGAGTPPLRAEAFIINDTQVAIYGEHWGVLRDPDLETVEMALSAASHELDRRATILQRIKVEFLDEYDAGTIEIGDTVTLAAMYGDDADTEIDAPVRIVKLTRTFNSTGEHVSAECVNHVKASEFYRYLGNVSDLLRWIVA